MKLTGNIITFLGVTLLIVYVVVKIFNFYGITSKSYGLYLIFYLFLLFCIFIFPNEYKKLI